MALSLISYDGELSYKALSSDVANNKIAGANIAGKIVYISDTDEKYFISSTLELVPYIPKEISFASKYGMLQLSQTKYGIVAADEFHFHVHDGTLWSASYFQTGIPANAAVSIGITTGARAVHLGLNHSASGDGRVDIYGASTFSGGTLLGIVNHNLSIVASEGNPDVVISLSPTISVAGSIIRTTYIPGGTGGQRVGGINPFSREFIVPPSTQSRMVYTNLDGNNSIYNAVLDFYEA